ncbi:MAG: hypothetical protein JWN95_1140 [Frankiales bacterium]|nr:hypothetical protein [Frankiales bacterium]
MPSDLQLSSVLSEFARTMATDFPIEAILDHLVTRIVEILPVSGAGVTLIAPGVTPQYIAASDASALRFEQLQTEHDDGPCLLAFRSGEAVTVSDLCREPRFADFRSHALGVGLRAVFAFPLRHGTRQLGALDLYRGSPGGLSRPTMAAAQTLADVAAAYLINAQGRVDLEDSSIRLLNTSLHDALTGLPNRVLLMDRLNHAFLRGMRTTKNPGLLFIDFDRFKAVNDAHGHAVGDQLLIAVSERLTPLLRLGDTLARLSGDEFVVLCEDLDDTAQAVAVADRLCGSLAQPFALLDARVELSASIGIAVHDPAKRQRTPEQLLHDADSAMYQAKRDSGSRFKLYDPRQQHLIDRQADLATDLHHALERGQLHTAYQPIVSAADGRVTGMEALLRWSHPTRGAVSPTTLIPIAEQSGLITEIGAWVLSQSWTDAKRWQYQDPLALSVNVSAHQLMSPGFVATVVDVLASRDADPALLTLEVTESVFVSDNDRALVILQDLHRLGVKLALDDFGTGYASLSYLLRFPIDILKIDRSFITNLGHDTISHVIIRSIIQLAHGLGMTVTAEGVETLEQQQQLIELDCDSCQGYYFARPLPSATLDALMNGEFVSNRYLPVSS